MKLEDFADKKPEFKLEEYFLGKTTANGFIHRPFWKGQTSIHCGNGRNSRGRCFYP